MSTRTATLLAALALLALVAACGGGGGGGGAVVAPFNVGYPVLVIVQRAGEPIADNVPTAEGSPVDTWSILPALPLGLAFDTGTGTISGTPLQETASASYTVTATNAGGSGQVVVDVVIGKPLPPAFSQLASGFEAQLVVGTPDVAAVAKIALAPDGRLFFIEINTGWIRMYDLALGLETTAYVDLSSFSLDGDAVTLQIGSHRGLIGLALDPDFTNNGYLYVMLSVAEETTGLNPRNVVLRFTDVPGNLGDPQDDAATNQLTVLDDLPIAPTNNGGELLFDPGGQHLFISAGDAENSLNAQNGASLAGKILRVLPTTPATIPMGIGGNLSGTAEWVRGVRNTYAMAFHPTLGGLFAGDTEGADVGNGFTMDDELNFVVEGKNFEWGAVDGSIPAGDRGATIWESTNVTVTPTSLTWHTGPGFSTATTDSLLMTTYNDHKIRQFVMTGPVRGDVDSVIDFATLTISPAQNQPIDTLVEPATGDIFVSLLSGIYRISAFTP